jgi:hypothetical protein
VVGACAARLAVMVPGAAAAAVDGMPLKVRACANVQFAGHLHVQAIAACCHV